MFKKMIKIAQSLDKAGRYSEADFITKVMHRMAVDFAVIDPLQQQINKKHEDISNNLIDDVESEEMPVGKPKGYGLGRSPGGRGVRPELSQFMKEDDSGREIIDFTDPTVRAAVKAAFGTILDDPARSSREKQEAHQLIQVMDLIDTKGRVRNPEGQLQAYGWFGVLANKGVAFIQGRVTPAGNPAGQGVEVMRKFFLPLPETIRRKSNVLTFMRSVLSNGRRAGQWLLDHDSANADKDPKKRFHDVTHNEYLSESLAPRVNELATLRKQKADEIGKGFPSRSITDQEFYVWPTSFLERIKNGNLSQEDADTLLGIAEEFKNKHGFDKEHAAEAAWDMFIGEGRQDKVKDSGRRTYEYGDINSISQVPLNGKKRKHLRGIPSMWPHYDPATGTWISSDNDESDGDQWHPSDIEDIDYPDADAFDYDGGYYDYVDDGRYDGYHQD